MVDGVVSSCSRHLTPHFVHHQWCHLVRMLEGAWSKADPMRRCGSWLLLQVQGGLWIRVPLGGCLWGLWRCRFAFIMAYSIGAGKQFYSSHIPHLTNFRFDSHVTLGFNPPPKSSPNLEWIEHVWPSAMLEGHHDW
jgi:hypothetical protein